MKAYANLEYLDDPRVGVRAVSPSPEPPSEHSTSPQPERNQERALIATTIPDIVLVTQIDGQVVGVESFCQNIEGKSVLAACQRLIAALRNFRRQYTLWILPDAGSSRRSSRVIPEKSINAKTEEHFAAAAGDA